MSLLAVVWGASAACGRSSLDDSADLGVDEGGASHPPSEAAPLSADVVANDTFSTPTPVAATDPCQDAAPIPCAGGGFQYCVAGRYSACPARCAVCVPGSQRVCFVSYCRYWGLQTCAADGLSFGYCAEQAPPPECRSIAEGDHDSSALEQCCLDHGYCCKDEFDLNHNGDTNELLGHCDGVSC